MATSTTKPNSISGNIVLIANMFWIVLGPAALAITTIRIVEDGGGWLTPLDFAFSIIVGLIAIAKWIEYRWGASDRSREPAKSFGPVPAFLPYLLLGTAGVWCVANILGNHVLR